jgi:hypothetical protein
MRETPGVAGQQAVQLAEETTTEPDRVTKVTEFCVDVTSETLSEALAHVGARAGFKQRRTLGAGTCHVVDEPKAVVESNSARPTILVVEPTPCGAHMGMKALAAGTVSAVISHDRPSDLSDALAFIRDGWALAPLGVVEAAARMPDLSERQIAIFGALVVRSGREMRRGHDVGRPW